MATEDLSWLNDSSHHGTLKCAHAVTEQVVKHTLTAKRAMHSGGMIYWSLHLAVCLYLSFSLSPWRSTVSFQFCFTFRETIRDGEPRTSTSTFTQLLSSDNPWFVQCCLTSTEIIGLLRDVHLDFRTALEFWQSLVRSVLPYVHRNHRTS